MWHLERARSFSIEVVIKDSAPQTQAAKNYLFSFLQILGSTQNRKTLGFDIKIGPFGMKPSPPEAEFHGESNGNDENDRKPRKS